MLLYVIKDLKCDFTGNIYQFANDETAVRALPFLMRGNELMVKYPQDFELFKIGEFDYRSGIINAFNVPEFVANMPNVESEDNNA